MNTLENYHSVGQRYSNDVDNFNVWFADEIEKAKSSPNSLTAISYIMKKLRLTPGLVDTVGFLNDIYDTLNLSVDYINIMHMKPNSVTGIWTAKIRNAPMVFGVDNMYDPALPTRKAMLFVPLNGTTNLTVRWLDTEASDSVVGPGFVPATNFTFADHTDVGQDAFIVDTTRKCMFDNSGNPNHCDFLHIGFEGNPTFEQVKAKFEMLK
jgi:hypothetical protein